MAVQGLHAMELNLKGQDQISSADVGSSHQHQRVKADEGYV